MLITGQGKTYAFTFETNGDGYIAEPYISYKNLGNNIIFQSSGVAISPQLSYNYNFQMAIQGVVTEISVTYSGDNFSRVDLYDNLAFTSSTDPNNADNQIETWSVHTSYRQLYFDSNWFNYRGYEAHQKIDNFNKFYHQGYNTATLSPLTQIKIRVYGYWNVIVVDRQFTLPYENFTKLE